MNFFYTLLLAFISVSFPALTSHHQIGCADFIHDMTTQMLLDGEFLQNINGKKLSNHPIFNKEDTTLEKAFNYNAYAFVWHLCKITQPGQKPDFEKLDPAIYNNYIKICAAICDYFYVATNNPFYAQCFLDCSHYVLLRQPIHVYTYMPRKIHSINFDADEQSASPLQKRLCEYVEELWSHVDKNNYQLLKNTQQYFNSIRITIDSRL